VTQEITASCKRCQKQNKDLSKFLLVKAGPTAMEKVLKQNLFRVIIYENKPRPPTRGCIFIKAKK